MFQDGMKMSGKLTISLNDEVVREVDNLVVTAGKEFVASRMIGTSANVMSHMAVGSGSTAAAAGDTALGSELGRTTTSASASGDFLINLCRRYGNGRGH
jgi:hypothetical protein